MLLAHVLAEVAEAATPRLPRGEHHAHLRAGLRLVGCARGGLVLRERAVVLGVARARAEPGLERAEREHDRVCERLERDGGVLLAQVEDEVAEEVSVVPALVVVDAAWVSPDEGRHGAAQRVRGGRVDEGRWRRRASYGPRERGQRRADGVTELVRAALRYARLFEDLVDRGVRQIEAAEHHGRREQQPGAERKGGRVELGCGRGRVRPR